MIYVLSTTERPTYYDTQTQKVVVVGRAKIKDLAWKGYFTMDELFIEKSKLTGFKTYDGEILLKIYGVWERLKRQWRTAVSTVPGKSKYD